MTSLINTLGGTRGFGENSMARSDDGSLRVDLSSVFTSGIRFYGTTYTEVFINTNGNLTFGSASSTYTPTALSGTGVPMIAGYYADADTRGSNGTASPGGNSAGTGQIWYDLDTVNRTFTVTWDDVGFYNQNRSNVNAFQIQLTDIGLGEWTARFIYEQIAWTAGTASGGNNSGQGGTAPRAGFSAGNGTDFFEIAGSGNNAAMLQLDTTDGNLGELAVWEWQASNGAPLDLTLSANAVAEVSDNGTVVATLASPAAGGSETFSLLDDAGGRFVIVGNELRVADGLLLDYEQHASHTVTIRVTDGGVTSDFDVAIAVTDVEPESVSLPASQSYTLFGGVQDDTFALGAGDDVIHGGGGADVLSGGAGTDVLYGDEGDDRLLVGAGEMSAGETYDGGTGYDTLELGSGSFDLSGVTLVSMEAIKLSNAKLKLASNAQASMITAADGAADGVELASVIRADVHSQSGFSLVSNLLSRGVEEVSWSDGAWNGNSVAVRNGDGSVTVTATDVADQVWTSRVTTFSAAGELVSETRVMDDGRSANTTYVNGVKAVYELTDISGAWNFATQTRTFAADGSLTSLTTVGDDGIVVETTYSGGAIARQAIYDTDDVVAYESIERMYDGSGRLASKFQVNDNGVTVEVLYNNGVMARHVTTDTLGAGAFQSIDTIYDNTGSFFLKTQVNGNGNRIVTGGDAGNLIEGGDYNDTLWGGGGADDFVFTGGSDRIRDFDLAEGDRLDLTAFGVHDLDSLFEMATVTANPAAMFIRFDADVLRIDGLGLGELSDSDFVGLF